MSNECNISTDCNALSADGVTKFCYQVASFSDEVNFCECSNWYGWVGEDCDEPTAQLNYWRSSLIITTVWSATLILAFLGFLCPSLPQISSNQQLRLLFIIGGFFMLTAVSTLTASALVLPSSFDPTEFDHLEVKNLQGEDEFTVIATYSIANNLALTLGLSFAQFGNMFIILSWIDVLKQTAAVFPKVLSKRSIYLTYFLKGFVTLSCIVLVVIVSLLNITLQGIFMTLLLLTTIILYAYFTYSFIAIIRKLAYKKVIKLVKATYIVIFVCLVMTAIGVLGGLLLSRNYKEELHLGRLNHHMVQIDIGIWAMLVNAGYGLWYVRGRVHNILYSVRSSKSKGKDVVVSSTMITEDNL